MGTYINYEAISLLVGILLDSFVGDPERLAHPIRFYGRLISLGEKKLNKGEFRRLKGFILAFGLVLATGLFFKSIQLLLADRAEILCLFNGVFIFYGLCNRSLISEALKVEYFLEARDIDGARKQLARIVGRDTRKLDETNIRRAVLETLSENLSDGVVAPLFYLALGGVPLMMMYKMLNTLDSMVGYKNEKYQDFGCFSARFDDLANFIPARLTAFIMVLLPPSRRAIKSVLNFGKAHASPNAGYPEAALAGILDCQLGGPNEYFGAWVYKPYIGKNARRISRKDVVKACFINIKVAGILYLCLLIKAFI